MKTEEQTEDKWPDEIRLKMIEKSEFYHGSEQIYQFGFYDGYQIGNNTCNLEHAVIKQLLKKLSDISNGLAPLIEYSFINEEKEQLELLSLLKKTSDDAINLSFLNK